MSGPAGPVRVVAHPELLATQRVHLPTTADVVVIGSGVVGAACTYELALAGLDVLLVDRGHLTGGASASGEGNLLVSDKLPGAELDLALASLARWAELADELELPFEYEAKGGIAVATTDRAADGLTRLARRQRRAGVDVELVDGRALRALEPHLAPDLEVAARYPQDAQVQPVLASSALIAAARARGARLLPGAEVLEVARAGDGRVHAVVTSLGRVTTGAVVNAAGPWSAEVARAAGSDLPVRPRRGHIIVTEPLPPLVRHKVYEADYVDTLVTDTAEAQVSTVVEGTMSGTILIGSSRELVGFDRTIDVDVLGRMAERAIRLFPVLAGVAMLRAYVGFRPWSPDHLPIIGPDPRVPGLVHATGHEGAGVGLAAATGQLVAALLAGTAPVLDPAPFRPDRPSLDPTGHHATTERAAAAAPARRSKAARTTATDAEPTRAASKRAASAEPRPTRASRRTGGAPS